jgi:hypothetical protein
MTGTTRHEHMAHVGHILINAGYLPLWFVPLAVVLITAAGLWFYLRLRRYDSQAQYPAARAGRPRAKAR